MLTLYSSRARHGEHPADLAGGAVPPDAVWIDLLRPDPDEAAFVQRTTGIGGTEHRRAQRNRELDEVLHRLFRSRATKTGDRRPLARESTPRICTILTLSSGNRPAQRKQITWLKQAPSPIA